MSRIGKPKLLDLFCCAGGAAMGYHRAGFDVTGVDVKPQPRYPFTFVQGDAIEFLKYHHAEYDAFHASPPCQRHSKMSQCRPGLAETYPDLILRTRANFLAIGKPWIIENVEGAPLLNPITLCGAMFYLDTYRHRLFEWGEFDLWWPPHVKHVTPTSKAGHWKPGTFVSVAGHCAPIAKCRAAMGIDWMNREELAEAIPPDYTEFIGRQMFECITGKVAA